MSSSLGPHWPSVVQQYPPDCRPRQTIPLANRGGLSGAALWRLATASGPLCLRRWPRPGPSPSRLLEIHRLLAGVAQQGISVVPVPVATQAGETFVQHAGHLWELTPWMPGEADFHRRPSPAKLRAAMTTLARFHQAAAATMPAHSSGPSPGIRQRLAMLADLRAGGWEPIAAAVTPGDWPELAVPAVEVVHLFPLVAPHVQAELAQVQALLVPLQPCLCDVWHDHVLFTGEVVTGLVDFGAMAVDNPARDVARLVGSLVGDAAAERAAALSAYRTVRPLRTEETALVEAFDTSGTLLSGANWLRWIYVEGRKFESRRQIEHRLATITTRLQHLAARYSE